MSLSHVGMAHKMCPACGKKHDEIVLLDKRLRNSLPRDQCIGLELCEEHKKEAVENDITFLIEGVKAGNKVDFTGQVAQLKNAAWSKVINIPRQKEHLFVLVEPGVLGNLQKNVAP